MYIFILYTKYFNIFNSIKSFKKKSCINCINYNFYCNLNCYYKNELFPDTFLRYEDVSSSSEIMYKFNLSKIFLFQDPPFFLYPSPISGNSFLDDNDIIEFQ